MVSATRGRHLLPGNLLRQKLTPGRHSDGGGLYLLVKEKTRSWLFLFKRGGKRREMGLGKAGDETGSVNLAEARRRAGAARALLIEGIDPLEHRLVERQREAQGAILMPAFGRAADAYIDAQEPGFRNAKHIAQWRMTLGDTYCAAIRSKPVDEVTTEDVLGVLQPVWQTKNETANRLRGRIERVLDAAKAKGLRSGENPARWRGHLDKLLPKRQKLQRGHHPAMPFDDISAFVVQLREREAVSARALEFLILTAARSGEVRGAEWSEIDLDAAIWTVPAARMKAGRAHRVPLTDRAVEILEALAPFSDCAGLIFSAGRGRMSDMTLGALLRRMGAGAFTVHGFRSSFRDWAGEVSMHQREIAEAALAHVVGDATERAYRRGDALEKRRALMADWERFVAGDAANVIPLRRSKEP